MKKLFLLSFFLLTVQASKSQLPDDISIRLQELQSNADLALKTYRVGLEGRIYTRLYWSFSASDRQRIDSLGLKLDIQMIYDKSMRERVLQLLKGGYEQYEIDTITSRILKPNLPMLKIKAFDICRFDTTKIFMDSFDSIVSFLKEEHAEISPTYYKYKAFELLRMDTTVCFKTSLQAVSHTMREERINYLLSGKRPTNLSPIAELAGYLGDSIFIEPLINALSNPHKFQKNIVEEALVRMRVEPYYRNYFDRHTYGLEEIKKGIGMNIDNLALVLRSQDSFLELSKHLFSNVPWGGDISEGGLTIDTWGRHRAYELIQQNIENEELKELHQGISFRNVQDSLLEEVYQWMQNNYGNYEIKRLW